MRPSWLSLPLSVVSLMLVHCSQAAPDSDGSPSSSSDIVAASDTDALCKDFQGEVPSLSCRDVPTSGLGTECAPGCIWSGLCAGAGEGTVCTKKGLACSAENRCAPDAGRTSSQLVQCMPRGEKGDGTDKPPTANRILCLFGCSTAGEPHCVTAQEQTEQEFCRGKTGDLPTLHCMKGSGSIDRLIECVPGGQKGTPDDAPDSARSIDCLLGCTEANGSASCNTGR